jgi:hypothetical protein
MPDITITIAVDIAGCNSLRITVTTVDQLRAVLKRLADGTELIVASIIEDAKTPVTAPLPDPPDPPPDPAIFLMDRLAARGLVIERARVRNWRAALKAKRIKPETYRHKIAAMTEWLRSNHKGASPK